MERHKCKLCFRSFSNGRALGGHMRSHMMNLPIPPKGEDPSPPSPSLAPAELGEEAESAPSPSRSQSNSEDEDKSLYYGLRENPKRSIRLVDPEFSFAVVESASVVILQDRESESESSKNPTRRRSKRARKSSRVDLHHSFHDQHVKRVNSGKTEPWAHPELEPEPEPASSVSDATTEEDVAFCLMMMSRDKWDKKRRDEESDEEDEHYEENEDDDSEDDEEFEEEQEVAKSSRLNSTSNSRNKYKCETCNKAFRSYQALGGHRASHKKIKLFSSELDNKSVLESAKVSVKFNAEVAAEKKVHGCPVCFRVFSSGQALGGHKRSHVLAANGNNSSAKIHLAAETKTAIVSPVVLVVDTRLSKLGESLIDLNLPAPDYDDDYENSQIELSALDPELVNPIIRQ